MSPTSVLLAVSIALNALMFWATTDAMKSTAQAIEQRDQARADATACSDATEALRLLADKRKAEADKARAATRRAAANHEQRADAILAKPASVPGDDCKSASERASAWLAGRKP